MIKHLVASLTLMISAGTALADTPPQAATCVACHGAGGVSTNPQWPSLAGQKRGYLIAQITAFRDGQRSNPLMAPMVNNLSDADIAVLASYYASQAVSVAASGDARLVGLGHNRAGYCISCHGMKGISANQEWPNLAGQQAGYLENQLLAFRTGNRDSGLMQTVIAGLSAQDLRALASYFSQLAPLK